jgi:hypothetical protein
MGVDIFWSVIVVSWEAIGCQLLRTQMYWGCIHGRKDCCELGKKKGESYKRC